MKKLTIVIVIGISLFVFLQENPGFFHSFENRTPASDQRLSRAYENQQSDIQVSGSGVVIRTLADDRQGSRHQKFILKLSSGISVLISHNIDLAPRINSLREGDTVKFYGEYEWNPKGGVVHWTHHDPRGSHEGGWLKHNGATYQ